MTVDRDLVEAARKGDREAYADLIRSRSDRLFAIAQRILRDVDRTEDAVQDALVIAWRDLPGLRDPDRFDAWLQRTLVNRCRDILRSRRRSREIPMEAPEHASPDPSAEAVARMSMLRAFDRLSVEDRHILVLHHLHDLSLADVAALLRIPVGTAKWRLHSARRALERALEAQA
jgi:RNA polymerase sigma-70 factor (ECF subfamily)